MKYMKYTEQTNGCCYGAVRDHDNEIEGVKAGGFVLPHDHGTGVHTHELHTELGNTEHFAMVSNVFKQLSDPNRVRIFWLLNHREECVVNIAAMMEMSSPAVSHHLRQLTESGLLVSRRDGKEVYYKAAHNEQNRMLHDIVEQIMAITCPEKKIDLQASQEEIIRNVHSYLMEHMSERITIGELGRMFLMNTTTLKETFKRVYGTTIAAHMRMHRMEQAAAMLRTTDDDISAIAHAVGYDSAARFATAFRETYDVAPSEYRHSATFS